MKRALVAGLVVAIATATVWGQGDPGGAGSDPTGGGTGSDPTGGGTGSDPTGSGAGSDPTGSGAGSDPTGSGAGSGSGSGPVQPPVIIIPADITPPEVSAAASPSLMRLGDRFTLFITAVYAPDGDVNLREPLELGGAFEVVRKRVAADKTRPDGKKEREWQVEVYAWDVGDLRIPPVAVTFTSQGKAGQVITNGVPVKVTGMLGDLVDDPRLMRGDTPPISLLSRDWFWLYVIGGAGVVLAGVGLFLYIRARRRRRVRTLIGALVPSGTAPRRIDMTSERALQQLLEIERSGVLDRDDDRKRGYADMVGVIREYLGARYRVATLDLTTHEVVKKLAKVAPDDERARIEHWLERCDLVKYGGFRATTDDAHGALDAARQLVISTTNVEAVRDASPREATRESAA